MTLKLLWVEVDAFAGRTALLNADHRVFSENENNTVMSLQFTDTVMAGELCWNYVHIFTNISIKLKGWNK